MVDLKLFSLDFVDDCFKKFNLCLCDGDKPSPLCGITLQVADSNLHQHGKFASLTYGMIIFFASSNSDVDNGQIFPTCDGLQGSKGQ